MGEDRSSAKGHAAELATNEQGASPVIASEGLDAARAYVGPTPVPVTPAVRVNDPKVKVTDPRRMAATMKITRPPSVAASPSPPRGTIEAPMDRPPEAFQPLAVDPALVQEWMARRGQPGSGQPGDAAANDAGSDPSRWAKTEKIERIDRSALPSSLAPKAVDEAVSEERGGSAAGGEVVREAAGGSAGRGVWIPLIVTVAGGLVVGLLVIKFFLLPAVGSGPQPAPTSAPVVTAAPGRVEPVAPVTVTAAPALPAVEPSAEEPAPAASAVEEPMIAPTGSSAAAAPSDVPTSPGTGAASPLAPRPWPAPKPTPVVTARPTPTPTVTTPKPPPTATQDPKVFF
jgi:hypothetical protein